MPTYGEVRTKFKDRLKRRDCTDALADGFLQDAQARIQRVLKVPVGEKSLQVAIDAGTVVRIPLPADFIQLKNVTINDKVVLTRKPLQEVLTLAQYGAEGTTRFYARQGQFLVLGPRALVGDIFRIDYYSDYEATTTPTTETNLLDLADDLLIYGALSYACLHWSDKRRAGFEEVFVQILSDMQAQADDDELSGQAAVSQAFTYEDHV